ncbi:hypothetical protein BGZ46_002223 [Entomortierella lignicola]|nr:hypothetical protein BGZ46_002223 [Entomortierella lignicola]
MSVIMCFRARTRLRVSACFFTYINLTIAVVGLLWSLPQQLIAPIWFWLWNFIAESVGIVVLCHTIVWVGNGFYPMAGKKNIYWKLAISLIVIYSLLATGNIIFYIQQKVIHHRITPVDFVGLVAIAKNEGICHRMVPGDWGTRSSMSSCQYYGFSALANYGTTRWSELPCPEMEVFARPNFPVYIVNQMVMILACVWMSIYLFVPLVRNNRHGAVARQTEGDTVAIGIWYLSCIVVLTIAYWIMDIYLITNHAMAFQPQVQALDLCLRATLGPVFFLPTPPCVIRYYQYRQRGFYDSENDNGANKLGLGHRNGSYASDIAGNPRPFTGIESTNPGNSRHYSEIGSHAYRNDETGNRHGVSFNNEATSFEITNRTTNPLRLFQSRNRGASTESSKMFSQDYDQGYHNDDHNSPEDLSRLGSFDHTRAALANSEFMIPDKSSTFRFGGVGSLELQRPEPVLTAASLSNLERSRNVNKAKSEEAQPTADSKESHPEKIEMIENLNESSFSPITGTTGWEVGGWNHNRQTSEGGNENSLSSPLDQFPSSPLSVDQYPETSTTRNEPSTIVNIHDNTKNTYKSNVDIEGLTGLQKQLAEHRSALLPVVLAMQELENDSRSFTETFGRDDKEYHVRDDRTRGTNRRYDDTLIGNAHPPYSELSSSQYKEAKSAGKAIGDDKSLPNSLSTPSGSSQHWSNYSASKSAISIHGTDDSHSTHGYPISGSTSSKGTDKSASGFKKKWLVGRKGEEDSQTPSKKLDKDPSSTTINTMSEENKSSKRNSIGMGVIDGTKGGKSKDSRRGVFSKVLGDRSRPSQDISDQERDTRIVDSDGKSLSGNHNANSVPATVEALALESTMGNFDPNVDEKGLQYYYPDPYTNLAEFKSPQTAARDHTASQDSSIKRTISTHSQKHPLSTIFSDDESNADNISTPHVAGQASSRKESQSSDSSKTPTKSNKSSKKSSKKDAAHASSPESVNAEVYSDNTSNVILPSANPSSPTLSPLGSLLSRTPSGSKKTSLKAKSRSGRSKSDTVSMHRSTDLIQAEAETEALPIPATNPDDPAIPNPAQLSLSPPPRQSWTRSKSFQGTTLAIAAAFMPSKQNSGEISIDTKLANQRRPGTSTGITPTSDAEQGSDEARISLSSPTTPKRDAKNEGVFIIPSPPLLPLPTVPTSSPSLPRLGNLKSRTPAENRTNSLDRDSEYYGPLGSSRTGFSTAAMDTRRASNRHQRSVDNLASAYYYKRAAELNSGYVPPRKAPSGLSREREREREREYDQNVHASAYAGGYFGVDGVELGGHKDPLSQGGSGISSNKILHTHKSKSSLDYSLPGVGIPGSSSISPSPTKDPSDSSRSSSLTNSLRIMSDDSWTQAMVARASLGAGAGGSGSGTPSSPPHPQIPSSLPPKSEYPSQSSSPSLSVSPLSGLNVSGSGSGSGTYHGQSSRGNNSLSPEFYSRPSINRSGSE